MMQPAMVTAATRSAPKKLRVLLMGKTGVGKSTLGNFMLGREVFETGYGFSAVTETANVASTHDALPGVELILVDTPGLCEACDDYNDEDILRAVAEGLVIASEDEGGVDAILYVLRSHDRFSMEQAKILKYFQDMSEFWPYVIVAFTNAAQVGPNNDEQRQFVMDQLQNRRCPQSLKEVMERVGQRFVMVESKDLSEDYRTEKVKEFSQHIEKVRENVKGHRYTNALFRKVYTQLNELKTQQREAEELTRLLDHTVLNLKAEIAALKKQVEEKDTNKDCFPGDSVVLTNTGTKLMKDIRVGDMVMCLNSQGKPIMSKVFTFLHCEPAAEREYIVIETTNECSLKISPNHLIFKKAATVNSLGVQPAFAAFVQPGDQLVSVCSSWNEPIISEVISTSTEQREGLFAPLTHSGTIIVDGTFVSCYASCTSHTIAHFALAPLRLVDFFSIHQRTRQPKNGVHNYAAFLYTATKRFLPQKLYSYYLC